MESKDLLLVLQQYPTAIEEPRKLINLLKDLFPEAKRDIWLLEKALDINILQQIQQNELDSLFFRRLSSRLTDEFCLEKDMAVWAVSMWCEAYGIGVLNKPLQRTGYTEECIYKSANDLYSEADRIYSAEIFLQAADRFMKVLDYKDSSEKYVLCKQKVREIFRCEGIYEDAQNHWKSADELERSKKWKDSEKEYALAEQLFKSIARFRDSKEWIDRCQAASQSVHNMPVYFQAKNVLSNAVTVNDFMKAKKLFDEVCEFSDANAMSDICSERIKEIGTEQQYQDILRQKELAEKEGDLKRRFEMYTNLIQRFGKNTLSEKARGTIEQCMVALDECSSQIEIYRMLELYEEACSQYEAADKLSEYKEREKAFSKILMEYKSNTKTQEFRILLDKCHNQVDDARKNVRYNDAVVRMNHATSKSEFEEASKKFEALSGFKDSVQKKELCDIRVDECKKQEKIKYLNELNRKAKKSSWFTWRKY